MAQTVEELAEILDNMKLEADRNAESFDKLLTTINNKLEFMSNDTESDDLIKVYLTELKKTLEERHALVVSEFSKIENSFKSLSDEQSNLTKTSEMKEMFDIFSRNMQSIAQELFNQKEILAQYDERFEKFAADKTDKTDIVNSVSAIRQDVEVINQGFETSISDINANIQSIFKNLIVMDPTAQNDIVRRELENIYLSTNAILTALHAVEQKNDDLAQNLDRFITKENFEQSQQKLDLIVEKADGLAEKFEPLAAKKDLDEIIYKTSEISEKINNLPIRDDLKYFAEKANELSAQIVSLPQKDDLNTVTDKTVENLQVKLDEISSKQELENLTAKTNEISEKFAPLAEKSDIDNLTYQSNQISEKIDRTATKEDLEQITGKAVAIEEKLESLPQQGDLADMYQSIHEFSTILDTLRANLTSANESTSQIIREQLNKLDNVLSAVVTENDFAGFRHDLADFIQKIIDNSSNLNENLNVNKETLQNLITKIESLDIHKDIETVANALDGLREASANNVDRITDEINNVSNKIDNFSTSSLEEKIDNVNDNIATSTQGIKVLQNEIFEKLSDDTKFQNLENSIQAASDSINALKETSLSNMETIVDEVKHVSSQIDSFSNESLECKLDLINDNISNSSQSIKLLQNEVLEKLSEDDDTEKFKSLNNSIDFLRETVMSSQESNEMNLTEKIVALRDMITANVTTRDEKFLNLHEKLDEFVSNIDKISNDTEIKIGNSISEISSLKSEIEQISKEFTEWNYGQETRDSKIVGMISSELGEIGVSITTLQDSVQAGVHAELAKNTETVEKQINNLIEYIETLKTELQQPDEKPEYDFETSFKELKDKVTSVKQEINLVNTDIIDTLNSRAEALMMELAPLKDAFESFSAIGEKFTTRFETITDAQTQSIENAVKDINNLIDTKLAEYSAKIDIKDSITATAEEIKEDIGNKINSNSEELKTLLSVAMNNDDITWAIDSLKDDLSGKFTKVANIIDEISNKNNEIKTNVEVTKDDISDKISQEAAKVTELLDTLNQKIDILALSDNGDDIELLDEIAEVKNMILEQKVLLEHTDNTEKISSIETSLEDLIQKINTIESTISTDDNKNSIEPEDLKELKEDILSAILGVFEQISFIEETEDIKDFVEEKTDEINKNLIEVKQQLNQIVNSDDDYSYTLQDVESDIAKLRLVISELSNTSSNEEMSDISDNIHRIVSSVEDLQNSLTQEQITDLKSDFERLSEDILSISSRTNKLLLTSDESYNALNNGLNDFSNIVYKLEERINYLDNKELTERIEKKVDSVANVVTSSANSDKVMRQALMYMGEWIDSTSDSIESISENIETINKKSDKQFDKTNDIQTILEELQNKMPEQEKLLNAVADRFEEQQERLDRLEMTLEKILSAIDDIDDSKLTKKVDKIDKQLTKLTTTIEKLASYVDE